MITVISARSEDKDKIDALDAGADDYLTKPFSTASFWQEIRGTFRRIQYMQSDTAKPEPFFQNGSLKIDYNMQTIYVREQGIHVTPIEYKILCLLAKNIGRVLTNTYITKEILGQLRGGGHRIPAGAYCDSPQENRKSGQLQQLYPDSYRDRILYGESRIERKIEKIHPKSMHEAGFRWYNISLSSEKIYIKEMRLALKRLKVKHEFLHSGLITAGFSRLQRASGFCSSRLDLPRRISSLSMCWEFL